MKKLLVLIPSLLFCSIAFSQNATKSNTGNETTSEISPKKEKESYLTVYNPEGKKTMEEQGFTKTSTGAYVKSIQSVDKPHVGIIIKYEPKKD